MADSMDKLQQRTVKKLERIKHAALELFAAHGADKVSMDEIAAKANVSKVTIYKYFGSKDELYAAVINLYIDETLAEAEAVLNSEMDFLEKLKFPLLTQTSSSQLVSFAQLYQIWEADRQLMAAMNESIQSKVKALMFKLYEEGKSKGYISEKISFDTLYLYSEIFRAGLKAVAIDPGAAPVDKAMLEALYDLHFFGLINKVQPRQTD